MSLQTSLALLCFEVLQTVRLSAVFCSHSRHLREGDKRYSKFKVFNKLTFNFPIFSWFVSSY